jgi:hypothetical protein
MWNLSNTIIGIGLRHLCPRGGDVGRPHVHRDALEGRTGFWPQALEIGFQSLLLAIVGHVNDHLRVDVVNNCHVLVPLLEGRLVHADLRRRL